GIKNDWGASRRAIPGFGSKGGYEHYLEIQKLTAEELREASISYKIPVWGSAGRAADAFNEGRYLASAGWEIQGFIEMTGFAGLYEAAAARFTSFMASRVTQEVVKEGITVLGHYPAYKSLATDLGAKHFQIPTHIWDKMTAAEQWAANTKFLDRMILRGDKIRLATPLSDVRPGSFFEKELNYLYDKGFKISSDGLWLVK
ncbi:MAG TPA: hypothetical protein VIM65_19875, partial [Cyclobacteriaceae bacterium]